MKRFYLPLGISVLLLILNLGCKSVDSDDFVSVSGSVINTITGDPVNQAIIEITSPEAFAGETRVTDESGDFQFVELEVSNSVTLTLEAKKSGYQTGTVNVPVASGLDIILDDAISLTPEGSDTTGGGGGVSGPSSGAATIILSSLSQESINIRETGGLSTTSFTFQVQDSSGRNLDLNNAIEVDFSIVSGPGGGEGLLPENVLTNGTGKATTSLQSGNLAGVVQVQAQIVRDDVGLTITSKPVSVTIHGGFPHANGFSLFSDVNNVETSKTQRLEVTAKLIDEFSNPVKPGTAVYFSTDLGSIQGSAQGHSNDDGEATVELSCDGETGNGTVTATTVNIDSEQIRRTFDFVCSTSRATIAADPVSFSYEPGESQSFEFTVEDLNGFPMAAGTRIQVIGSSSVELSGSTDITLGSHVTPGPGATEFNFTAKGADSTSAGVTIIITVTSPSGQVTNFDEINGTSSGGGGGGGDITVPGEPGEPNALVLIAMSDETINIQGTGGDVSTTFTFEVQDSAGRSMNTQNAVDVTFSILSNNPGGASISPEIVTTNSTGKATATLQSGTASGVVQIQAEVERTDGTSITSTPIAITIHGGFPDFDHFTFESVSDNNIEGFDRNGEVITYQVRLGDEYSNPVKPGTAVYFSTTGGVIQGSASGHTDNDGYAEVTLFAGDPRPTDGRGFVTATTVDRNSVEISKTSDFIFATSKAQIIANVVPPNRIDYTVTDLNGNPMPPGTTIQVENDEGIIVLTGDVFIEMNNELETGVGSTDYSVIANPPSDFNGSEDIILSVLSPSGIRTTEKLTINITSGGGSSVITGEPSTPASIILKSMTESTINIKETGGAVNSYLTFQVLDSSGTPMNLQNSVDVEFSIIQGPGGGEDVTPSVAPTGNSGEATAGVVSGTAAGVVQVQASVLRDDGLTIKSTPVAITIHGGFPDQNHFTLEPVTDNNIEGFNRNDETITYRVQLGDEYSNPVKPGTAVYFSTTGGVIQGSKEGHTDNDGFAEVTLFSGEPRPVDGRGTVTATTIDKNSMEISKSSDFLFTTSSALITPEVTTLELSEFETFTVNYTVTDLNGNPMPPGTTVDIIATGSLFVQGDLIRTLSNSLDPGVNITDFSFTVTAPAGFSGSENITIQVESPSGVVTSDIISVGGTGGGVAGEPSGPAAILLDNLTERVITVQETGGNVNTAFTFQVVDSAGRSMNLDNPVEVFFDVIQGPGGGEDILPSSGFTNATGRITASLVSGTIAGVVRIRARIERPDIGLTILSTPVAVTITGGFPDLTHFSISPAGGSQGSFNIEGFNINGIENMITAIVGDQYGNPVKEGTAVYFETTGGIIQGAGIGPRTGEFQTDELGEVSAILLSGNPRPANGQFTITASTIDRNNNVISVNIPSIFSTSQAVISANPTTFDLAPNGGATFTYTVEDENGNPMAAGTTIQIAAGSGIELSGDYNFTLGDYLTPGPGRTEFTFSIRDTEETVDDPADLSISITVTTPSGRVTTLTPINGTRRKVRGN